MKQRNALVKPRGAFRQSRGVMHERNLRKPVHPATISTITQKGDRKKEKEKKIEQVSYQLAKKHPCPHTTPRSGRRGAARSGSSQVGQNWEIQPSARTWWRVGAREFHVRHVQIRRFCNSSQVGQNWEIQPSARTWSKDGAHEAAARQWRIICHTIYYTIPPRCIYYMISHI